MKRANAWQSGQTSLFVMLPIGCEVKSKRRAPEPVTRRSDAHSRSIHIYDGYNRLEIIWKIRKEGYSPCHQHWQVFRFLE